MSGVSPDLWGIVGLWVPAIAGMSRCRHTHGPALDQGREGNSAQFALIAREVKPVATVVHSNPARTQVASNSVSIADPSTFGSEAHEPIYSDDAR